MTEKKKQGTKEKNKEKNAAAIARTQARKAANKAKNQAQYEANKARVKELGLTPVIRDKVITKVVKNGKKTILSSKTVSRPLTPAELLRKHARENKILEEKAEYNKRDEEITALEEKIG